MSRTLSTLPPPQARRRHTLCVDCSRLRPHSRLPPPPSASPPALSSHTLVITSARKLASLSSPPGDDHTTIPFAPCPVQALLSLCPGFRALTRKRADRARSGRAATLAAVAVRGEQTPQAAAHEGAVLKPAKRAEPAAAHAHRAARRCCEASLRIAAQVCSACASASLFQPSQELMAARPSTPLHSTSSLCSAGVNATRR